MIWILIITFYTNTGVAVTTVPFNSQNECQKAGEAAKRAVRIGVEFACVEQSQKIKVPLTGPQLFSNGLPVPRQAIFHVSECEMEDQDER